jgi:hypothetical protein
MTKKRIHLLLEPEQHQALAQIARREGRSVSELTREIVQEGIDQRQKLNTEEKKRQLQALERGRMVRQAILKERGGEPLNINAAEMIEELREERDDQVFIRGD